MSRDTPAECIEILNRLKSAINRVQNTVDKGSSLINATQGLVEKMQTTPDADLSAVTDAIPNFRTDLERALRGLLQCPFIADSVEGAQIQQALHHLRRGESVPGAIKDAIDEGSRKRLEDAYNEATDKDPASKLDKAHDAYGKMLDKAGVTEAMQAAEYLYDCIERMCSAYTAVMNEADKAMDQLDEAKDMGQLGEDGEPWHPKEEFLKEDKKQFEERQAARQQVKEKVQGFSLPW